MLLHFIAPGPRLLHFWSQTLKKLLFLNKICWQSWFNAILLPLDRGFGTRSPMLAALVFSQQNKASNQKLYFFLMSNHYIARFTTVRHKARTPLPLSKRWGNGICKFFFTSAVPHGSGNASVIVHSPLLAVNLSSSDLPQRSDEWFALRRNKLTTSTFSTALGFWKGKRRSELWHEKVFLAETQVVESSKRCAMEWGVLNEATAIDRYKSITGHDVDSLGFAIHSNEQFDWLGASPDGLLGCFPGGGILEVKCPYNKGKPEIALPWSTMPFYYMPQVQGQMEIMDRDWVDLYCWTTNGSTIFRVHRERSYWELIHGILKEFWWENVMPAREALSLGREIVAKTYEPASTHKQTGFVIHQSIKLASEAKLLCREIAGHIEFYR